MRSVIATHEKNLSVFERAIADCATWTDLQRTRFEQQRLQPLIQEGRRLNAALHALDRNLAAARRLLDD